MGYNDSAEFIVTQASLWKGRVASERYLQKTIRELESELKPRRKVFSKSSLSLRNGYNIEMLDFQINTEDLNEYPDW